MDDYIDEICEEIIAHKSTCASINRYYNERNKRKVANRIRKYYPYIHCQYGKRHDVRYGLWEAMKAVGWRRHDRRGWYDKAFIKKLYSSRARHTKVIPNGNQYRKVRRKCNTGITAEYDGQLENA
jgi:hypothetical protein